MLSSCPTYYIEDHKIPEEYTLYTYSPDLFFPKASGPGSVGRTLRPKAGGVVKVFKYTKEWLETEIRALIPDEWGLKNIPSIFPESRSQNPNTNLKPKTNHIFKEPTSQNPNTNLEPNHTPKENPKTPDYLSYINSQTELYLDVETYPFENKNTLTNLGLRTIQLDHHYIIWEDLTQEEKASLLESLVRKNLYVFNLNMEASQLKHAGFQVDHNTFYDISLLARMCLNNRIGEYKEGGGKFDLGTLARNLLKDTDKEDLIDELMKEFKIRPPALRVRSRTLRPKARGGPKEYL